MSDISPVAKQIIDCIPALIRPALGIDEDSMTDVDEKRGGVRFQTDKGLTFTIVNNFWDYFDLTITDSDGKVDDDSIPVQSLPNAWNLYEFVIKEVI
jgi:hypothetical protein